MTQNRLFQQLNLASDGIYSSSSWGSGQEQEIQLRKQVATDVPANLEAEIATHHSFQVMDKEAVQFANSLPQNAVILDVGGCWGWHWRDIAASNPGLTIIILDLVRENLARAHYFLGPYINKNVFLVHGDGTKLPFANDSVDGYWAVQSLQHVPVLEDALLEAKRVLRPEGRFAMHNLNNPILIKTIYKMLKKPWVDKGAIDGMYFLRRSGPEDAAVVHKVFGNVSGPKYSEVIFTPELNFHSPAKKTSWFGRLDATLSSENRFFGLIARQCGYSAIKKSL